MSGIVHAIDDLRPADALRGAAFAAAARHSRHVRFLRLALPTLALLLAVGVAVLGIVTRIEISLSIGDVKITAEGLSMDAPKLSGSDGKGRTFSVTAVRAVQNLSDPRIVRLEDIVAEVRQADGQTAVFRAAAGIYDAGRQSLVLKEGLSVRSSDGSAADLTRAEIDLVSGDVKSDAPVSFSSSLGAIRADGMEVGQKGGAVTFEGGVRMTVDPGAAKAADSLPFKAGTKSPGDSSEPTPR